MSTPLPPRYLFPKRFKIGRQHTEGPLVEISQVKGHLALLHAFAELRYKVETTDPAAWGIPHVPFEMEPRWGWFVGLAVERFEIWATADLAPMNAQNFIENYLPPLDVLMVWHAYMLNPSWYSEDGSRIQSSFGFRKLEDIFPHLLDQMASILDLPPTYQRISNWRRLTQTSYEALPPFDVELDPPWVTKVLNERQISCPTCRVAISCPYLTEQSTGYLQQNFSITCEWCACTITKDLLGLRKIAANLVLDDRTLRTYLAGTLCNSGNRRDTVRAKAIKDRIMKAPVLQRPTVKKNPAPDGEWETRIVKNFRTRSKLQGAISFATNSRGGPLPRRIMSAYCDDKPFSLDLVGAVLRQGTFVDKMYKLKWTEHHLFSLPEDEVALQHAVARYHAFLDLMSSSPASFFVPTLDIDLVWHTHQLMLQKYDLDCTKFVGRFIDHDDKVEEGRLSSAFDLTCRAWQQRFNIRYTHCGCPLPGKTIGDRLGRLLGAPEPIPVLKELKPPDHATARAGERPQRCV